MPRLRQRLAVSARARAELPPNLQRYADTGEALIAEPFRGITADGRRFLLVRNPRGVFATGSYGGSAIQLLVVQNWLAELRRTQGGNTP